MPSFPSHARRDILTADTLRRAWPMLHNGLTALRDDLLLLVSTALNAEATYQTAPERYSSQEVAGAFGLLAQWSGNALFAAELALGVPAEDSLSLLLGTPALPSSSPPYSAAEIRLRDLLRATIQAALDVSREQDETGGSQVREQYLQGRLGFCLGLYADEADADVFRELMAASLNDLDGEPGYRLLCDRWSLKDNTSDTADTATRKETDAYTFAQ